MLYFVEWIKNIFDKQFKMMNEFTEFSHMCVQDINSFNKTEAAIFPCRMFPESFPFHQFNKEVIPLSQS